MHSWNIRNDLQTAILASLEMTWHALGRSGKGGMSNVSMTVRSPKMFPLNDKIDIDQKRFPIIVTLVAIGSYCSLLSRTYASCYDVIIN